MKFLNRGPNWIVPFLLAATGWLGCRSDTEPIPLRSPDWHTPIVTGIVITDELGNELGTWGTPSEFGAPEYPRTPSNGSVPTKPALASPYPNPTNGLQGIQYALPAASYVKLWIVPAVLDGKQNESYQFSSAAFAAPGGLAIRKLSDETQPAGVHHVQWDTLDDNRQPVPAGFYRIYCQIDDLLLWRDVFIARDPCDLPSGLRSGEGACD
jgi:hypothetical protein